MYDKNNIFAKILRKELPCKTVYEDHYSLIFHDVNPCAPVHLVAIPKGEFVSFDDFSQKATDEQIRGFFLSIQKSAQQLGIAKDGYRLITNHGKNAMQTVEHFHVHILAGKPLGQLVQNDKYHL
ncbi:HIT domain-containing protein [Candidatus Bandiella euplotis]|uniref:HIT-like protein n=1 Tax=Candidatus Bandiella euplotis TaxID=1664265 RepID=A0ABZ0UL21_9RICK|nr:HIT domain-containing protein [Candidatus Bandiella woodruffii]WPX96382.1 HIT-like protein [Candidatus Bandiella woodruffii]